MLVEELSELTVIKNAVKLTFYRYPHELTFSEMFEDAVPVPDLLTLAAMKAYVLGGGRAKWKDYVDLYFIFKSMNFYDVVKKANEIFASNFNEKLFRTQLSYFDDIDYSETVELMPSFKVSDDEIRRSLVKQSLAL